MELYLENWENGRMILNSVQNGPLVWPTVVEEDGTTRTKRYEELSVAEKLQADCDLKATNIFLQGLPPDVLPPEWSKFVTDVKLARDLHTTNYDWYRIFTKGQKQSQTGQNRGQERKEREEKSKSDPIVKKSTGSKSSQSQPREVALERASKTEPENLIAKSGPTHTYFSRSVWSLIYNTPEFYLSDIEGALEMRQTRI
ncbi:hypothetical protein Tco_0900892 [Tanacetum coccineum]